jgi:hypothetical protein
MVDLKRLLVPLATGALSAKVGLMAKEKKKEEQAIEEAEGVNSTLVTDAINTSRNQLTNESNIQNQTYNLMVSNYNILKDRYGADKEDDLALLYTRNRGIFKSQDITKRFDEIDSLLSTGLLGDIVGEGRDRKFVPGADITGETPQIKSIYEAYGQDVTAGDIIKQQQDKYNKQVNAGLSNLAGENNTKLFIDKTVQPGMVREKTLQRDEFQTGRVSQEQFMTNINDIVDQATMQDLTSVDIAKMSQTVNWSPVLSAEDLNMAAINAIPGVTNQDELLRERYKFSYLLDTAKTIKLQNGNVETTDEAIDILRANGRITRDSVMNSLTALDRAVLDRVNQLKDQAMSYPLAPESQALKEAIAGFKIQGTDQEKMIDVNGVDVPLRSVVHNIENQFRETAKLEYSRQGYYDLFNRFVNVGDDDQFDVMAKVPVQENEESPFVEKQVLAAVNPQILSDGGLQVVDKKDIYETIDVVDSRDLFGVYGPDGITQLKPGNSGIFSGMDAQARENLKEQIILNSGGMEAIKPFLVMSDEEFKAYEDSKKITEKKQETEILPKSINRDNYENFLPPELTIKKGQGRGASFVTNPELINWAKENMSAWESFVNSIGEKPKASDYPEDQRNPRDPEQQYGIDLRFYNTIGEDLIKQLPKIQKLVKDRE